MNARNELAEYVAQFREGYGHSPSDVAEHIEHALGWRPPVRIFDDPADVPVRAVIWWPDDGTLAARFDETHGVVFGDARPFAWSVIQGPVTLVWEEPRAHGGGEA